MLVKFALNFRPKDVAVGETSEMVHGGTSECNQGRNADTVHPTSAIVKSAFGHGRFPSCLLFKIFLF
jgi:hypothetical protein